MTREQAAEYAYGEFVSSFGTSKSSVSLHGRFVRPTTMDDYTLVMEEPRCMTPEFIAEATRVILELIAEHIDKSSTHITESGHIKNTEAQVAYVVIGGRSRGETNAEYSMQGVYIIPEICHYALSNTVVYINKCTPKNARPILAGTGTWKVHAIPNVDILKVQFNTHYS